MVSPARPFERYRTRSALFLMIYAVTAIVFGFPNILMVTNAEDRFLVILASSFLVVSRYIGYFKLAGYALLEPDRIKAYSGRIAFAVFVIIGILIGNAAFFLYRFGLYDISITAISAGSLITSGLLISHLIAVRRTGLNRSRLMRMVSGVLIVLGSADICITRFSVVAPLIGIVTLFFGIYTERKSLALAIRQTVAVAASAGGCGIAMYYLRWYLDPALMQPTGVQPSMAIAIGLAMVLAGLAYYTYSRRTYATNKVKR
jgi:hypothetical protein